MNTHPFFSVVLFCITIRLAVQGNGYGVFPSRHLYGFSCFPRHNIYTVRDNKAVYANECKPVTYSLFFLYFPCRSTIASTKTTKTMY